MILNEHSENSREKKLENNRLRYVLHWMLQGKRRKGGCPLKPQEQWISRAMRTKYLNETNEQEKKMENDNSKAYNAIK